MRRKVVSLLELVCHTAFAMKYFILKELSRQLKGYDLEPFVADLLRAMGYRTTVSPQGGGLLLEDDDYFYLYHGYDNCVYKTEKKTGVSDKIVDGYCLQINLVDGMIYANHAQDGAVVEIDPENGEMNEVRKGDVEYLIAADNELYFSDTSDNSLRRLSLDSMEERLYR